MGLTITPTQLRRKKRNDGTIAIYIRFTEDRRSRYKTTGIMVKPEFWDRDQKRITKAHPLSQKLNMHLDIELKEIKSVARKLEKSNDLSTEAIFDQLPDTIGIDTILHQAKIYLHQLDPKENFWPYKQFRIVYNNLKTFILQENRSNKLEDFLSPWITSFQQFLSNEKGHKNSTIHKKIQRLKRFARWLMDKEIISFDPFDQVKRVKKRRGREEKIYLSHNEIEAIKTLALETGSRLWHVRNFFLYSFYNGGILFSDLCRLTWENVSGGRLQYMIGSTGGEKNIAQIDPMKKILQYYQKASGKRGYIFPILDFNLNEDQASKQISSNNAIVNKALKNIAGKIGTDKSISFQVSKHSFAHYAFSNGMRTGCLHFALGNKRLKTTINYLKSLDNDLFKRRIEEGRDEVIQEAVRELKQT